MIKFYLCKWQKKVDKTSRNPATIVQLQKPLKSWCIRLPGNRPDNHASGKTPAPDEIIFFREKWINDTASSGNEATVDEALKYYFQIKKKFQVIFRSQLGCDTNLVVATFQPPLGLSTKVSTPTCETIMPKYYLFQVPDQQSGAPWVYSRSNIITTV